MIKRLKKPTILMIDDEERILRSLTLLFKNTHQVFSTSDPEVFMQTLQKEYIHIILSDQRMPKARGTDLLKQAKLISPNSMRILLTGYADSTAVFDSVNEGEIYRYVTKPWDPNELKRTIGDATQIALKIQRRDAPETIEEDTVVQSTVPDSFSLDDLEMTSPVDGSTDSVSGEVNAEPEPSRVESSRVPDKKQARAVQPKADLTKQKVLIIDSDSVMFEKLSKLFGQKYDLLHANSLELAVDFLIKNNIAVAISDIKLGVVDIAPIIKVLKHTAPSLVTIVLTKYDDTSSLIELINEGQIYRCLPSPISVSMLNNTIIQGIEQHRKLKTDPNEALIRSVDSVAVVEEVERTEEAEEEKVNGAALLEYVRKLKAQK